LLDWIKSKSLYLYFFLALGLVVRLGRFDDSIFEMHSFRQTQTAFLIRNLANDNYNLVRAELPVLGYPWQVPLEFPLFQTGAAYLMNSFGWDSSYSGRLLSTFAFLASAAGAYFLTRKVFDASVARIVLPIFLFTSFAFQWGSAVLIEWVPVLFAILSFVSISHFVNSGKPKTKTILLLLSAVAMSVAALSKITTALVWIIAIITYVVFVDRIKTRAKNYTDVVLVISILCLSLIPSLIWNRFADEVKSRNSFTLWLTSENMQTWNFGTLQQRLDLSNWKVIYDRVDQSIFGVGLAIVVVVLLMIFSRSENPSNFKWILIGLISGPLVFFNLYLVHDYYLVAIYPLIIMLISLAIDLIAKQANFNSFAIKGALIGIVLIGTFMSQIGSSYMKNFIDPGGIPPSSKIIATNTDIQDQIIVIGCDWDPTYLYFADRRGLMLMPGRYNEKDLSPETLSDYKYVYLCNGASADILPNDIDLELVEENLYTIVANLI
jgi:hypothetical protein